MSLYLYKQKSKEFDCLDFTNHNDGMSTKEIRSKRLADWFAERTLPEREKSYLSQLINGKTSFGERAARRIERDYNMPPCYLDAMDAGNEHDGSMPSVLSSMLTADEVNLIKFYRGFPDSEKKTVLIEFETKFKKYNQLFAELLASRK